jgi:hypothetical protein
LVTGRNNLSTSFVHKSEGHVLATPFKLPIRVQAESWEECTFKHNLAEMPITAETLIPFIAELGSP